MRHWIFTIKEPYSEEDAREELIQFGFEDIYCIEEEDPPQILIGGCAPDAFFPGQCTTIEHPRELSSDIDWNAQWKTFSPLYQEGNFILDLSSFYSSAKSLKLHPGKGFGDLSHPTTRLMIRLMASRIAKKRVIDIGCGSGILSLVAARLGASGVYGIDLSEDAIAHAQENAVLNALEDAVIFSARWGKAWPRQFDIALMNMTFEEQKIASSAYPILPSAGMLMITSGILVEQLGEYLQWTASLGWDLMHEEIEEGWMGFIFKKDESL